MTDTTHTTPAPRLEPHYDVTWRKGTNPATRLRTMLDLDAARDLVRGIGVGAMLNGAASIMRDAETPGGHELEILTAEGSITTVAVKACRCSTGETALASEVAA